MLEPFCFSPFLAAMKWQSKQKRGDKQMLFIRDLKKTYGINEILKQTTLSMKKGECLALTGPNGCGKTTLLKCIVGESEPDSGEIFLDADTRFGYLKQRDVSYKGKVKYFLLKEFEGLQQTLIKMDAPGVAANEYTLLMDDYIQKNGFDIEIQLLKELGQFGFEETIMETNMNILSPGQKKIMETVSIMIVRPDLFIMDEPTNHLDISMRVFLENYINRKKRQGISFLIVSHDRTFLDRVTDQTVYIKRGVSQQVKGGYSHMLETLDRRYQSKKKESENIEKKIGKLEQLARKKTVWSSKVEGRKYAKNRKGLKDPGKLDKGFIGSKASKLAKTAKATAVRKNRLIERLKETKPFVEKPVKLPRNQQKIDNRIFTDVQELSFRYEPDIPLLEDITFQVSTKDRIALIGENGCGKTTFLKLLNNELRDFSGSIYRNEHVRYAYITQNIQRFFVRKRLIENFDDLNCEHSVIHAGLKSAGLKEEALIQDVKSLSRGELMKAALVKVLLSGVEFILMDEPTNHLDIETLEVLQEILGNYNGGMMFISHDRRFVSQNADDIYTLEDGKLRVFHL